MLYDSYSRSWHIHICETEWPKRERKKRGDEEKEREEERKRNLERKREKHRKIRDGLGEIGRWWEWLRETEEEVKKDWVIATVKKTVTEIFKERNEK